MQAFPFLKEGEVAVLLADPGTGYVLGLDMRWNLNPDGEVYRAFATEGLAVAYVEGLWASGIGWCCGIWLIRMVGIWNKIKD